MWRLIGSAWLVVVGCGGAVTEDPSVVRGDGAVVLYDVVEIDSYLDTSRRDAARDTTAGRLIGDPPRCDGDGGGACAAEDCREGLCCNGDVIDGRCVCGEGAGCDVLHICCQRRDGPVSAPKECLDEVFQCRGYHG